MVLKITNSEIVFYFRAQDLAEKFWLYYYKNNAF